MFFLNIYIFRKRRGKAITINSPRSLLDSDGKEKREFNEKGIGCKYVLIVRYKSDNDTR